MGNDAMALAEVAPTDGVWASVFRALGSINRQPAKDLAPGLQSAYDDIATLKGTDHDAGTLSAAVWMGHAVVRTACNYDLLDADDVPEAIREECGVCEEDKVVPPEPPQPPETGDDTTKRDRTQAGLPNVSQLGGPLQKVAKPSGVDDEQPEQERAEDGTPGDGKHDDGKQADDLPEDDQAKVDNPDDDDNDLLDDNDDDAGVDAGEHDAVDIPGTSGGDGMPPEGATEPGLRTPGSFGASCGVSTGLQPAHSPHIAVGCATCR